MVSEFASVLLRLTLLASIGVLAVLALRGLVQKLAGPRLAYGLWLLIPLLAAMTLAPPPPAWMSLMRRLPAPAVAPATLAPLPAPAADAPLPMPVAPAAPKAPPLDWRMLIVWLWGAGLAGFAVRLIWLQIAFARKLGRLAPDPILLGVFHAGREDAGPAVVGLLRSRIVLPADFADRYEPQEQALIVAHERRHLRDRHPLAGAAALALLALQWFNPLGHLALRLFRLDQELACDAAVIAAHPDQRATYARAMLKAGGREGAGPAPLGQHVAARGGG